MASEATTQSITNGQIGQINDRLATKLRGSGLLAEHIQLALAEPAGLVYDDMVAALRRRIELLTGLVVRRWRVADRSRPPMAVLEATGRKVYRDRAVVAAMPRGKGEEGETVFFKLDLSARDGYISDEDLDKEFDSRNLEPELPDNLAEVNRADPAFADEYPNATHWQDADGNWCYAAFDRWGGERRVNVRRDDGRWGDYWWFAGRRKSVLGSRPL